MEGKHSSKFENLKEKSKKLRKAIIQDRNFSASLINSLLAFLIAVIFAFIILFLVSDKPLEAYKALLLGPISNRIRIGNWIEDATNLTLAGLAIILVFKTNQFSMFAEGQLYIGALVAGIIALKVPLPPVIGIIVPILGAVIAGAMLGFIPGILKAYYGADELVSTLMLNQIAIRVFSLVLSYNLRPPKAIYTWSDTFPENSLLPRIVPGTRITIMSPIVILVVIGVWVLIYRTPFGYKLRMVGSNINFSEFGGINTKSIIVKSMVISGIPAALIGTHLALGVHRRLILNISAGMAFEGVVVALLAGNNPLAVPFTALLYSYIRTGGDVMEISIGTGIDIIRVVQSIIIIFITANIIQNLKIYKNQELKEGDYVDR